MKNMNASNKIVSILLGLSVMTANLSCSNQQDKGKQVVQGSESNGTFYAKLVLPGTEGQSINFLLDLEEEEAKIINGKEEIAIDAIERSGDSLYLDIPIYDAQLNLSYFEGGLKGEWRKYQQSGKDYSLFFLASKERPLTESINDENFSGRWQMKFEEEGSSYPAVGIFHLENGKAYGTILTETGDYRYLNGYRKGDEIVLQTFDGAHAFLFTMELDGDSLRGQFRSGPTYRCQFSGYKNAEASLKDQASLTKVKDIESLMNLCFIEAEGEERCLKDLGYKEKAIVIQILGSWCPNCRDESLLLQELYEQHQQQGLEVIGLSFEYSRDTAIAYSTISKMSRDLNLEYPVVFGGYASKKEASERLFMMTDILSFPTTIFIDRQGELVAVHTGFSGPGTGEIYLDYKEEVNELVEEMLILE